MNLTLKGVFTAANKDRKLVVGQTSEDDQPAFPRA